MGTELSPWVAGFARETFGVEVLAGPVESLALPAEVFDVVILNDVLEHLPNPVATLSRCASLLAPGGFFVIQTPEYREHLSYAQLRATDDLFLRHMDRNNDEHLYLYSRRSVGRFFAQLGYPQLQFSEPVYAYDMAFTASRTPLLAVDEATVAAALGRRPQGRLVQALLDKAFESADRGWAIRRLETQLKSGQT
jgi:SAM-dependent methyltransferase